MAQAILFPHPQCAKQAPIASRKFLFFRILVGWMGATSQFRPAWNCPASTQLAPTVFSSNACQRVKPRLCALFEVRSNSPFLEPDSRGLFNRVPNGPRFFPPSHSLAPGASVGLAQRSQQLAATAPPASQSSVGLRVGLRGDKPTRKPDPSTSVSMLHRHSGKLDLEPAKQVRELWRHDGVFVQ